MSSNITTNGSGEMPDRSPLEQELKDLLAALPAEAGAHLDVLSPVDDLNEDYTQLIGLIGNSQAGKGTVVGYSVKFEGHDGQFFYREMTQEDFDQLVKDEERMRHVWNSICEKRKGGDWEIGQKRLMEDIEQATDPALDDAEPVRSEASKIWEVLGMVAKKVEALEIENNHIKTSLSERVRQERDTKVEIEELQGRVAELAYFTPGAAARRGFWARWFVGKRGK